MLAVCEADFTFLALDYLGLVTRTIWWEESSRKHLLSQLYYLDQLENSIIDNVSIMSESWLFPCILFKSGEICPQLWQERPSDPKTHIVYIWPLLSNLGYFFVGCRTPSVKHEICLYYEEMDTEIISQWIFIFQFRTKYKVWPPPGWPPARPA